MSKFNKLPKGKIKKNGNFYGWAFIGVMFSVMGIVAVVERRFQYRSGTPPIEGNLAVCVGLIFIIYGLFSIYHLFFKAEKKELEHIDFHVLEDFEEYIDEHKTIFEVARDATLFGNNSTVSVVYYKLRIEFNKNLYVNLTIKRRDKFEYFLWKLGITRKWDVLTNNPYFDSRYQVICSNRKLFKIIFNKCVIELLEKFDRDYPPIRDKNGILVIKDEYIQYIEGPYNEQQRLFDPHRGKIESIFRELIKITNKIEENVPCNLSIQHKNQINILKNNIINRNKQIKEHKSFFNSIYILLMYVICSFLIITALLNHS